MHRFVAYYRVSTDRQGRSGLGLEAQRSAVAGHVRQVGGRVVDELTEVESGKRADRPELARALLLCRAHGATLVIAKLDRLARNVAFVSAIMESGVEFVAVDFPQANRLTIHILAAVAEHEREMISTRTKAALAVAKAQGVRLGSPQNLTAEARAKGIRAGARAMATQADRFAHDCREVIRELQASGFRTLRELSEELNARGIPTARGGRWNSGTVWRVMGRETAA